MWKAGPPGLERCGRMGRTSMKDPGPRNKLVIQTHAERPITNNRERRAGEWRF